MAFYRYEGEEELVFPTLGVTVKNGDEFEGPDGLTINKLVIVDTKKPKTSKVVEDSEAVEADPVNPETQGE
jgi:hypothetical protein